MKFLDSLRWKAKQRLAGKSRYYGDGGTIHHTGYLDVETYQGEVVAVWFRCQRLPFEQSRVDLDRARELSNSNDGITTIITGVEVLDD